jgi:hypothetical protein
MRGLLADVNIQGQVETLRLILESAEWSEIWRSLGLRVYTFADVGLARNSPDNKVWRLCQTNGLVLLTANRNKEGADSLEATIRAENTPASLPVITLADSEAVRHSGAYAARAAIRLLDFLLDIDRVGGTGRLYIP